MHLSMEPPKEDRQELLEIISGLTSQNEQQGTVIHKLETQNEQLATRLRWFEEQFHLLRHKQFGKSSERTIAMQGSLFNEAEVVTEQAPTSEDELQSITYERKKPGRKPLPQDLPVERIEYDLPEQEKVCPECGGDMHKMGEAVRKELVVIPAQAKVREHVRFKYSCRCCEKNNERTPIKEAEAPHPVIAKGYASPSLVAYVMTMKYVDGVPLYRQEKHFERLGLKISRSVLSDCAIKGSEWLKFLYLVAKAILVTCGVLHADETTLQVLKELGRAAETKSYMWLYRTGGDDPPIILYEYQETRSGEHPRKFLEGFRGYLHVDGYVGYEGLEHPLKPGEPPPVKLCGCWAHLRRKFDEAMKGLPASHRGNCRAKEALERINRLFAIERGLLKCSPEERLAVRREKSLPEVQDLRKWMEVIHGELVPKSLMGVAVTYGLNQWDKLVRFLEDGRVELSNNRAERSIKPFVIGRKNFLFCNTPGGAQASAIIYSIIETAKENGLNPYAYLTHLFERLPNMDTTDAAAIEQLLPWNVKLSA